MLKQKRIELKKLPDTKKIHCIVINIVPFKGGIEEIPLVIKSTDRESFQHSLLPIDLFRNFFFVLLLYDSYASIVILSHSVANFVKFSVPAASHFFWTATLHLW